jgi:hypothetical protein
MKATSVRATNAVVRYIYAEHKKGTIPKAAKIAEIIDKHTNEIYLIEALRQITSKNCQCKTHLAGMIREIREIARGAVDKYDSKS